MTYDKHGCAVCGGAFDINEGTLSDNIGGFQDFVCNPCEELEICLVCSSDKDINGLVICSECDTQEGSACGACGEWSNNGQAHNCSEEEGK